MPTPSSSIGTRKDLPVRIGNSLVPQILKLGSMRGSLDLDAGTLVTGLYVRETDETPISDLNFTVTRLQAPTSNERWWRLDLSTSAVRALAEKVKLRASGGSAADRSAAKTRVAYWTASFEAAAGARWSVAYGKLTITLGAAGA